MRYAAILAAVASLVLISVVGVCADRVGRKLP